jgi:hypothetical protein
VVAVHKGRARDEEKARLQSRLVEEYAERVQVKGHVFGSAPAVRSFTAVDVSPSETARAKCASSFKVRLDIPLRDSMRRPFRVENGELPKTPPGSG